MNLETLHPAEEKTSIKTFFKTEEGSVISISIKKGEEMKEHITKSVALLTCVIGKINYEEHTGRKETLSPGDYLVIPLMVSHKFFAEEDSQLLLIK
jgi:quercetin dioxygenase-like cupin family protein